jgi:indolepyruvate ferredoxin oxidoreductase
MALRAVSLDDKYDLSRDRVFLTGAQAVVRLLLMQQARDKAAGLNTAGLVSGYRGSPLGGIDQNLWKAKRALGAANIVFNPGLNEELAATALWGAQQSRLRGEGRYDGVFGLWYGKGPGVDRAGDVFRHANMAGTDPQGGVVCLMGDDHMAESSTNAHQTEFVLIDKLMPVLNPATVQEILDYGLHAYALSRYAGVWVGLKCVKDNVESTASIDGALARVAIVTPQDFMMPSEGLGIRTPDDFLMQEERLFVHKRAAILAYSRANHLNRIVIAGGASPRIGIVTVGKSYLDVRQAMDDLGIDEARASALGLRLIKIGCSWPLDPADLRALTAGLALVIVVEEKRALIEGQLREALYDADHRPMLIGKHDETGAMLFAAHGALDPNDIAIALGERLLARTPSNEMAARLDRLRRAQERAAEMPEIARRIPTFCSGCPHNSSTKIPDGTRAYAGIGCHYMAQWMERGTDGFTAMGGEGANWVGEAPFSTRGHVFQNLGDGTYNHSGSLALRFAVASGTNVTYKILFNDAVAMTGGQTHEGGLSVDMIARQVAAEGVERIALVTDEPDKYPAGTRWPERMSLHHRDALMAVQSELAAQGGVTVMIYDQTCAAEKRRRRKRGTMPDPDKRVIINTLVCEGCGDCGVQSNCVSVQPVETEFGRKRRIDQSNCNKDFSCVNGFCPSFVTVHGARPRKQPPLSAQTGPEQPEIAEALPDPVLPVLDHSYALIVTGIGGTGVVTIGAILGMAAHLEGKGCGMIDMAGLAQKGGEVFSHIRIAPRPEDIHAIRVSAHMADLVLGCDLVVTGNKKVLAAIDPGRTAVVANIAEVMPGDFARNADYSLPSARLKQALAETAGADKVTLIDATAIATARLGNSIAGNMLMLGLAYQRGLIPLSAAAIERAIALNGEAVAMNLDAFRLGRQAAIAPDTVAERLCVSPRRDETLRLSQTLDEVIARRIAFLKDYQNEAYAARYAIRVAAIRALEQRIKPGQQALSEAVARGLFKLMAVKDEYEVARLYTSGAFQAQLAESFEGEKLRLEFHLAPPLLARRDPHTGLPRKMRFGPWMMQAFRLLARLKGLRGTPFDLFGYTAERRMEQELIVAYENVLTRFEQDLTPQNHPLAVTLAALPEQIRGFGHIKERNLHRVKHEEAMLLAAFSQGQPLVRNAAE